MILLTEFNLDLENNLTSRSMLSQLYHKYVIIISVMWFKRFKQQDNESIL